MILLTKREVLNAVALFGISVLLSAAPVSSSFLSGVNISPTHHRKCLNRPRSSMQEGSANNNDPIGSYLNNLNNQQQSMPTSAHNYEKQNELSSSPVAENADCDDSGTLKASRFSKYAPDANTLDATDFRSQLMENMKADLERRRVEDPNRGNQPTRNYLAGL
eukprot:CAMPEP_0172528134 /NCGR_PEP_ID=MMETSP1067-20121228/2621_1 /TAXON_ID=265564 ORGANISM="Thalassiosira punctigera, Strain Tpunct2005C2" /NCGR_SAMPLE_ID=MMETSP1067 /ASSEMBLY_ACC=CAM_ASM_000444 /LENGTH=162 /DNA_ID=CAMNT_0013311997 /DNA_START=65 /DNA_END=553 /DNA_ORIENTATION=+